MVETSLLFKCQLTDNNYLFHTRIFKMWIEKILIKIFFTITADIYQYALTRHGMDFSAYCPGSWSADPGSSPVGRRFPLSRRTPG